MPSKDYLTLIVKRGHFYHVLKSRTPESNVFTPYLLAFRSQRCQFRYTECGGDGLHVNTGDEEVMVFRF